MGSGNRVPDKKRDFSSLCRLAARISAGVAAAIGCTALLGWLLEMPRLASLGQGLIPMAPSTALLFAAYGGAILLAHQPAPGRRTIFLIRSVFACGALVSLLLLVLNLRGVFPDLELLGMGRPGDLDGTPIGHMSPVTALTFLLLSLLFPAVATAEPDRSWRTKAAWWIAGMLMAAYTTLILAYLFGTPLFYGGRLIPPAASTSLAFMALGIALSSFTLPAVCPETGRRDQELRFSTRLLIMLFFFLVGGIVSAGYFYHRNHEKHYLKEVEQQLSAVSDLKIGELMLWREERLGNAGLYYDNPAFAALVKSYFRQPGAQDARRGVETWIDKSRANRNYDRVFLLDGRGKTRLSLPASSAEPLSGYVQRRAVETLQSGRISFTDFYRNEFSGKIYLGMLVPLFDPAAQGHPLGVLVMRIDPEKYLYPFIRRWPISSATAETLLVRREGDDALFLNELRFRKDAALNLRIPLDRIEIPAVMAALGRQGVVRGKDYRGKPVLAALRSVPDSPWHLVTRMDLDEIYAPMRERQLITALLVCAMLSAAATGVGLVWRQQSTRFYRDRYEAELARLRLEERLVKIASNLPGAIFQLRVNPDGSCLLPYASSGLESLYGVRPETVAPDASPLFAALDPADSARVTAEIFESARTLSPWRNEHRALHPQRGDIWVEVNATPEIEPNGSVLFHGFITEISERKQAEDRIQRHITVMRGINRVFQDAMGNQTAEKLGERCLAVAEEITGSGFGFIGEIGADGFLQDISISNPGWDACKLIDQRGHRRPPGNFVVHGIYGRVLMDGKGFYCNDPATHPDRIGLPEGHPPLSAFLGVPLIRYGVTYGMIAVGKRAGGYGRDDLEALEALAPVVVEVFLRQKTEVALQEREARLRRAEEMANLGHWRYDLATGRVAWSDEMYRIFGCRRETQATERTPEEISGCCHPDDLEQCLQSFDPAGKHDGSSFEYRIIRPDGGERHVASKGELLRDEYGTAVALFGTLLDTTELNRKERELQEKNAELERFTYMISHDLKSPLVTLKTFLGYLGRDLESNDADRIAKDMHFMRSAADRMGRLLEELLEMSRVGRVLNQPVAVTCQEVIEEALNQVAGSIAEGGVEVRVAIPDITLFGDRPRLVEIWQNLLENACKFMGEQAHPLIEIGFEEQGRRTLYFVRDNGIGIEQQYQEKIFGLFEKLDRNSEGTGLGLALVKRIVELNGGTIRVESQGRGLGSCFSFTLPACLQR
jgi:PAS domain S-box-containing protein